MLGANHIGSERGAWFVAFFLLRNRSFGVRGFLFILFVLASTHLLAASESNVVPSPLLALHAGGQNLELSREQLLALPQHRMTTTTAWTSGVKVFEGPLVRDVLALLDVAPAATASATLRAWNDYEVAVGIEDYYQWDAILAHRMNGRELTLLDHGPLWVVYPRDEHIELQDSRFDHRWAWMLRSITVAP